jgi:hypothetical protein
MFKNLRDVGVVQDIYLMKERMCSIPGFVFNRQGQGIEASAYKKCAG